MGSAGWKIPPVFGGWTRVEKLLAWGHGGGRAKKGWTEAVAEGCGVGGGRGLCHRTDVSPTPFPQTHLPRGPEGKTQVGDLGLPTESECVTHNWGPWVAV